MSLSTMWTQGVPEEKKEEVVKTILNSQIVLDRLHTIIDKYIEMVETEEESIDHFNHPEWANRQAYHLGRKRELKRLKILVDGAINE